MLSKNAIIRTILIVIIIILLTLITVPVAITVTSSCNVLISNSQSQFFYAKSLFVIGNRIICLKGSSVHQTRQLALKSEETNFSPAILTLTDYVLIEIITKTEEIEKTGEIQGKYLGIYQVTVTGHTGFLYLSSKDGYLYGSIQFPKWANGVYEPLKKVHFSNGKINFIRSITDSQEMKRIGANNYFVQQYSGEYSENGAIIKGFYIKDGTNHLWQAVRIK
jgi:hypothetical protein